MQDMLVDMLGKLVDGKMVQHPKLRTLWNEYFVAPWCCWSLALYPSTPLNIANNQPIEAWHKGVMTTLRRALKGTTAAVLEHSFPKLVHRDALQMPDKLRFTDKLPTAWLATAMYTKAAKALVRHMMVS